MMCAESFRSSFVFNREFIDRVWRLCADDGCKLALKERAARQPPIKGHPQSRRNRCHSRSHGPIFRIEIADPPWNGLAGIPVGKDTLVTKSIVGKCEGFAAQVVME